MSSLEEKRVFEGGGTEVECLIASETGLVQAPVSGNRIGGFGMALRADVRDVAADAERVLVATGEGIRFGDTASTLTSTGLDPGMAVGLEEGGWLAAVVDGRVVRVSDGEASNLGQLDGVTSIDPPLIGAAAGVHKVPGLENVGLDRVDDVVATAVPRAATGDGLFRLGNGWIVDREGRATAVAGHHSGRAAAILDGTLHQFLEDDWEATPLPGDSPAVDVALGPATYVVTDEGTLCVNAGDGWRTRALGVTAPRRLTVRPAQS